MTENTQPLSPNKQALLKIRQLKQQLAAIQPCTGEPIAVVSMACRFPRNSDTPEKFWQSLIKQEDLVSDIPDDRWDLDAFYDEDPEVPGKMYARRGVFLAELDRMDPEFFGISPREATWVDPQQRLLMEVAWEAIERAGWIPQEIADHTGVFVGWMHNDYQNEASDSFLNLNPYIATGAAGSFLCGRLAYHLGLQGPSVAVDTACSSSLVALHLAIQSLQQRDCDRALVGGVNVVCSPTTNILTCKLKALSPSGHSRAFDAAADGYLRGEGCGVVTLRRLADAEKDNDTILGIVRGSAVGHNGTGSGLTVPNPKAQEKVIRQALERAGFDPRQVDYLEAHGTGTSLGDPIEINAASAAYCGKREANHPLLIGSVKTNIGHLEAAAGIAGLIKVLLALQNGSIPGQMNFQTPNPHIAWDKIPVKVLTRETHWPNPDSRVAGVSAFGMSGTNAHVIVEAPRSVFVPRVASAKQGTRNGRPLMITLSGKCEIAVFDLAKAYAQTLADNDALDASRLARQSNIARSHFQYRAAIVATDRNEAQNRLQSLARGGSGEAVFVGNRRRPPRVAWQFTGQGSQYVGMGKQLYETYPVYRDAIDWCDGQLKSLREGSLLEILFNDSSDNPQINNTHWTQPAIFALQMGLAKLLQSYNLHPEIVLGHSVGQYAAACVAEIMSWEDGLRLIAERGRLIGQLPPGGSMLAVFAPATAVRIAIEGEPRLSLAALNGTHTVVSGDSEAIGRIEKAFSDRGVRTKSLTTSHAFHSHLMDPALEPFTRIADTIELQPASMPLVCNISGQVIAADEQLDGQYWARHIRQAVAFGPSIETLKEMDCELLIELGPQPVLTRMAAANWNQPPDTLISCLQKDGSDNVSLTTATARMYAQGLTPDFRKMHQGNEPAHAEPIHLPTYPFQRRRFWGPDKPRAAHAEFHTAHPLLGNRILLAGSENETRYESFIDNDSPPWMPDHEVMNSTVLPGAALIEMAIEVAGNRAIENVVFEQPIRPVGRTAMQTVVRKPPAAEATRETLETYARVANGKNWSRHFSCELGTMQNQRPAAIDLDSIADSLSETDSAENFYQKMNGMGLNYGPAFRCIQKLRFSKTQVLTHLQLMGDVRGYHVAPTLLDSALHSLAVGLLRSDDDQLFLPVGIGRVRCFAPIESEAWCHARWTQNSGKNRTADLVLVSKTGDVLLQIDDLQVQRVSLAVMRQMSGAGAERLVYDLEWRPTRLSPSKLESRRWLVIRGDDPNQMEFIEPFQQRLINQKHRVTQIQLRKDAVLNSDSEDTFTICGRHPENWAQLFDSLPGDGAQPPFDGVVWFLTRHSVTDAGFDYDAQCVVSLVQSMIQKQWRRLPCGMQLITRDAIAVGDTREVTPQQTQFWGLGRVIGAEQPELRCRMLDLPTDQLSDTNTIDMVIDVTLTETLDNQHAVRDGQLFVPRMRQTRLARSAGFTADKNGCYLVTGGLGMLGRQVAKWLGEHGASQVVLVSRREPNGEAASVMEQISASGCQAIVYSADMSSRSDVEALFERFGTELHPLKGVIHAAGVLDDGLIESQTAERFEKVLKPKILAAKLLDELTRDLDLDLFVLYSSAASVLGSPGQSNYATGNAFLDGLAAQRRAAGLPALAINWGPWAEGMADDERIKRRLALQGIAPLTVDQAHSALEKLIANNAVQATVMDVDWRRMRMGPTGEVPPMLQDLVGSRSKPGGGDSALVSKLRSLRGNAQRELLLVTIQESLRGILSTSDAPETDRPLIEMGLDSLMAVEFGTELQQMLGDQFPVGPTMLFDHPTIDAICDYVLELVTSQAPGHDKPATTESVESDEKTKPIRIREDIAVIGMSCRFPGAENVHQFWQNLLKGVDSVRAIPPDRWDVDRFYSADREPGKMYTRAGGFLDDIAGFDAAFFNISEQEACWIDPQHRMLLENSYRALEDAGIPSSPLADSNVGVFMGMMGSDYAFLPTLDDQDIVKGFQGAGLSHSAGVGRISYLFGFEGPSVAVDTASSSSLVAVFQAMRSLQEGNCNLALAGGVNAILAPVNSLLMSQAGLLSADGRCKSFSKSADGFGRGEGCGVVVLKRLSDAQRDGDRIMAVIRGGAVVHNGFSGGITSPSGKAQTRVIDAAIKDAALAPSQVQYLEAHGTGTEYGDPMEIDAAIKVYGKGRNKDQPLLVGSVKANISHLEAAGGSPGLIKTVLALHHGIIPRQIHFDEPSPHIPWQRMPAQVVTKNTPWPECERPTAGITALGLVGTNAHLVLSSPPIPVVASAENKPVALKHRLLVVSARSEQALIQLCRDYAEYLEQHSDVDLDDFCFTLSAGRRHYERRLAISFDSREEAINQLRSVAERTDPDSADSDNGRLADGAVAANRFEPPSPIGTPPKLAWVFGDGRADCVAILRELVNTHSVVAELVAQCDQRLGLHTANSDSTSLMARMEQPGNEDFSGQLLPFVLQASLCKLWQSWGIQPDASLGLGVGQYSAACVAGCLCFLDALILVYERDQLIGRELTDADYAAFEKLADQFNFYPPHHPLVCSLSGQVVPVHRSLGGSYWRQHLEQAGGESSFHALSSIGCDACLIIGPMRQELLVPICNSFKLPKTVIKSFTESTDLVASELTNTLGQLYQCGCSPDFGAVYDAASRRRLSLPTYPFQRKRYWITEISKYLSEPTVEVESTR